jgi:hypothetical protein
MLESINRQCVDTFNEFALNVDKQEGSKDSTKWLEIFQRVKGEIRIAMDQLEDEFRRLLGDASSVGHSRVEG